MYIAKKRMDGRIRYWIRESYEDGEVLKSRELFDLGDDPTRFIVYPGGNAYYVHEDLEDAVRSCAPQGPIYEQLENILWPFVRPDIRHNVEPFRQREKQITEKRRKTKTPESVSMFHLFDRRRIHYLRYGQLDQGRIGGVSPKLFSGILRKCRDEIEQYLMEKEAILRPHEEKTYVYVIFDLQRLFPQNFAKIMPQALDPEKVDRCFLDEICRLDADTRFWTGMKRNDSLHHYLTRYLFMHFDNDFGRSSFMQDYIRDYINSRRDYIPPRAQPAMSRNQARDVLGLTKDEIVGMSRVQITRIYRRKALEMHPDKGGDSKKFIRLTQAYQALIRNRK